MKKARVAWIVAAAMTLNGFVLMPAHAMTILHCVAEGKCSGDGGGGNNQGGNDQGNNNQGGDGHDGNGGGYGAKPTVSVPEPGSLMLLAAGFGAMGFGAWRRGRKKD